MSKRAIPTVAADFQGVMTHLAERGIVPERFPADDAGIAKRMHRATYSLILWRFRLPKMPEHAKWFVEEIASDSLQVLPQAMIGFGKTTKLLIRGVVENVLRHVYFADHPIEFRRMNDRGKWYVGVDELLEYAGEHPLIAEAEKKFDAVHRLRTLYDELSAGVHGRRVTDLETRRAVAEVRYDRSTFELHTLAVEKCAEATNFVLAIFHKDHFHKFTAEDRHIITNTMTPGCRKICYGLT